MSILFALGRKEMGISIQIGAGMEINLETTENGSYLTGVLIAFTPIHEGTDEYRVRIALRRALIKSRS